MYDLIFDLGANKGKNIAYYLSKSKKVLAVEANPVLADKIRQKYSSEINIGSLVLVNKAITNTEGGGFVNFFINNYSSGLSRFTPPKINPEDFKVIQIPQISFSELVDYYGKPNVLKIDLEGFDKVIINYMLENNLLPPYLQFENCGSDTIEKLAASGFYNCWNIVAQYNFKKVYEKNMPYAHFNPIGADIISPWLNSINIIELYKQMPHSWFDIHAKIDGAVSNHINFEYYKNPFCLLLFIKKMIPHRFKAFIKRMIRWDK